MPQWTREQLLAIETRGRNLLVSANAGSGKTAVLVERVIRLVLNSDSPAGLDRFLIVTYTEAAAGEMREKIAAALQSRLQADPENAHLRRQMLLLGQAQISTIHAFCYSMLRQYFHKIGLDPECGILSEEEGRLLRSETARALIARCFADARNEFLEWMESIGSHNPEVAASAQILALHDFLQTQEDPDAWIAEARRQYPRDGSGKGIILDFEKHAWFAGWRDGFLRILEFARQRARTAQAACDAIEPRYGEWILSLAECLDAIWESCAQGQWAGAIERIQAYRFPRMKSVRDKSVECAALLVDLQSLKEFFLKKILGDFAVMTAEQASIAHAAAAHRVHLLLDLASEFGDEYTRAKRRKAMLDFSDLEQMGLRLLREGESAGQPSEVALYYQDLFDHVLVDEYQDVSPVQEAILRRVSRTAKPGNPNNLFAVGDVKQCIYEFRLAEPAIFLSKYDSYPVFPEKDAAAAAAQAKSPPPEGCARIDLNQNFRSRAEVLHGINAIFRRIMRRDAVGLDYDRAAMLQPGAAYPPAEKDGAEIPLVEFHLLENKPQGNTSQRDAAETENGEEPEGSPNAEEESAETSEREGASLQDLENLEREAFLVGRRILRMVGSAADGSDAEFRILDRNLPGGGEGAESALRPVQWRDIVILLRAARGVADTLVSVLTELAIPVYAVLGSGYFQASEVRDMLALLQIIDNPLQDIPLAAVLRSPLENWNETELALVRAAAPDAPFYHEAFFALAASDNPEPVACKAADFARRLEDWRTRARRAPLADLISAIYEETGYLAYVSGLPGAAVAKSNLQNLLERAAQFDQFSRQGLARFLRFLEDLQEEEGDFGIPSPMAEGQNAVRIMTVHKSKGLEFPVVFVAGLGRKFDTRDSSANLLFSAGPVHVGSEVMDAESMIRYTSPALRQLQRDKRRRQLAEEMRILYVAMTRARERLILTGSAGNLEKLIGDWEATARSASDGALHALNLLDTPHSLKWIGLAFASNNSFLQAMAGALQDGKPRLAELKNARFRIGLYSNEKISRWRMPAPGVSALPGEILKEIEARAQSEEARGRAAEVMNRIRWSYPHEVLTTAPSRILSSEMKRLLARQEEAEEQPPALLAREPQFQIPLFATEETNLMAPPPEGAPQSDSSESGAQRGILTHLVLQRLDLRQPLDYIGISAQLDRMIDAKILAEAQRPLVDLEAIARFFESELGRRMLAAPPDRVWREVPFSLGLSPEEAGIEGAGQFGGREKVVLHGVIDCLVEEPDGIVLIDYKIDRIPREAIAARRAYYLPQMRIYQMAVGRIFPLPLKESYLYFLSLAWAEAV